MNTGGRDLLCNTQHIKNKPVLSSHVPVALLQKIGGSDRRGGRKGSGKEMSDKEKKISELRKHLIDCDKRYLALNLLNDAVLKNSKLL